MFTKVERLISSRNLRPKKKEGFLKIISIFSFLGIMLGVAILIIVMSVMNGFKTELTNKILGLNPHIVIQPNGFNIDEKYISKIKDNFKDISLSKTYSGEGVIINNNQAKGIIFKGVNSEEKKIKEFLQKNIVSGDVKKFKKNNVFIGSELAFNLNLNEGDRINLMSSAFVATPLGSLPKQENFKVAGVFNTGFVEFDQNIIFLTTEDALSIFDKDTKDQNLEIYLQDPLEANLYKEQITGSTKISNIMGKYVILVDKSLANDYDKYPVCESDTENKCYNLKKLTNLESGTIKLKSNKSEYLIQQAKKPPYINDENTTDVSTYQMTLPDNNFNYFNIMQNPNSQLLIKDYGVQIICYNFFNFDKNLEKYEKMFFNFNSAIVPISKCLSYFKSLDE